MQKTLTILAIITWFYLSPVWSQDDVITHFDCKKPHTPLQNSLCSMPELANLYEALNLAYDKAYYSAKQPAQVEQEQQQWLNQLSSENRPEIIRSALQTRTEILNKQTQKQLLVLQQTRPYPILAIKRFLSDLDKVLLVRVSPYFLQKMHQATFDGLNTWLFVDKDNVDAPAPTYLFARSEDENNSDKVAVNNCASYEQALKKGYDNYLGTSFDGAQDEIYYDLRDCKIISLFKTAKPARLSYVRDFQIQHIDQQEMQTLMQLFWGDDKLSELSDLKYYPASYTARMKFMENGKMPISISFEILGWADFDGDGLDDMLIEVHSRGLENADEILLDKVFIITRKQAEGPITIMKVIDEIS